MFGNGHNSIAQRWKAEDLLLHHARAANKRLGTGPRAHIEFRCAAGRRIARPLRYHPGFAADAKTAGIGISTKPPRMNVLVVSRTAVRIASRAWPDCARSIALILTPPV